MGLNIIDAGIILIILMSVLIGYQKGLIRTLGGIFSTLAGLGIAYLYRNEAAVYLQDNYGVVSFLTAFLEKRMSIPTAGSNQNDLLSSLVLKQGLVFVHH
jgi:hypothetical protein